MSALIRLLREEEAATAVEYAVMLALVLLACLAGIAVVGTQTQASYDDSSLKLKAVLK